MEWVLPVQKLLVDNISISYPWTKESIKQSKPIATLSYRDENTIGMPTLSLLLPPIPIVSYDAHSGRLELDTSGYSLVSLKLQTFQENLLEAIRCNQELWFGTSYTSEDIRSGFQPFFEGTRCILHCPMFTQVEKQGTLGTVPTCIPLFHNGAWKSATQDQFIVGKKIRVAIKIHGISFLVRPNGSRNDKIQWTSRSRIQHRILGVIVQDST
jgi:hypothetical protein